MGLDMPSIGPSVNSSVYLLMGYDFLHLINKYDGYDIQIQAGSLLWYASGR
jgi:hypothetical protein